MTRNTSDRPRRRCTLADPPSRRARLGLEALEDRAVPSARWVEEGPGPLLGGQPRHVPGSPNPGAIEAVVQDPVNPNVAYAGTVGGGVWRTRDFTTAGAAGPHPVPPTHPPPPPSLRAVAGGPPAGPGGVR